MNMHLGIGEAADTVVNYILDHFMPFLDGIAMVIGFVTGTIKAALTGVPPLAAVAVIVRPLAGA